MNQFQINEKDLGELEHVLPQLAEALTPVLTNRLRAQLRRCQSVLSNVRWNYGPHSDIELIQTDDDANQPS